MVCSSGGCLCPETVWVYGCPETVWVYGCSWFQKFNFDSLLLLAPDLITNNGKHIQICVSFVDLFIYHDFRDLSIFHPLFGLESKIMTLSQKFQKSDFLVNCSFTQLVNDVEKLSRKPNIFVKVIRRFWYVQHVG